MSASRAQRAVTAERRAKCLALVLAGATWDTIAERLDYRDKGAACKDFTRALQATQAEVSANAATLRQVELLRLDRLQAGFWPRALAGDHRAGKVVLDVHDRRVRLLGLDAAQRTLDNAVDAWLSHLGGAGIDDADAEALAAVA